MKFVDRLAHRWSAGRTMLCVGLDPDPARFPAHLKGDAAIFDFCRAIVDATHDLVCAFKPQIAFFAAHRAEDQLEDLIAHIHARYPDVPVILDAKRGDVGSTSEQYAREVFERYGADATTVQPYQGYDAIAPYLAYPDKGTIILCRTSNLSGDELQALQVRSDRGDEPLYLHVARLVAEHWNTNGQCGLVVGATYPKELAAVREVVGDMPILVPGVGAQGGDLEASVAAGATAAGGLLVSSSRAVLYAGNGEDFADAARRVAIDTRDAIEACRS
ncbi:MAG: orotidine-5'-phosphate decarboxylase [Burkholderiaceae bacterium]